MTMRLANSVRDLPHQTSSPPQLSGLSRHRRRIESTYEKASNHEIECISACRHVHKRFSHQNNCSPRSLRELVKSTRRKSRNNISCECGHDAATDASFLDLQVTHIFHGQPPTGLLAHRPKSPSPRSLTSLPISTCIAIFGAKGPRQTSKVPWHLSPCRCRQLH